LLSSPSFGHLLPSVFANSRDGETVNVNDEPLNCAPRKFASFVIVVLGIFAGAVAAAAPAVPTPLGPVKSANVTVPATMSWSAVTDPSGAAIAGYNWKVSPSPSMTPVVFMDSVNGATTQDTLSGLVAGGYFWQVQAASTAGEQSAWSPAQSFNVTGAGPGTPATPSLGPTRGYSTFHPYESVQFNWSAVSGAPTYRLEVSNDPNFPLGTVPAGVVTFWFDNIRAPTFTFVHHPSLGEGTFYARVFATDSDFAGGIRSLPSNVIQYTVFYNNPIGPAPVLQSPINGETLTLPVTLTWADVPNPQAGGYLWEVAKDSTFSTIEAFNNQYTDPRVILQSLTPGPKFWRVLSQQGLSSPTTNANTAWSTTGRFTISSAPPVPVSIAFDGVDPPQVVYSGVRRIVSVQLTATAPAGGASVALSSSNPGLAPVPATITMPGGVALASFEIPVGQVTVATPVTLSATINGASVSGQFTVMPPTLNNDPPQSTVVATGGATMTGWVDLEGFGFAPAGGFIVNLASNSSLAVVPSAVTIPAGARGTSFQIQTSPVSTITTVTITASRNGVSAQWPITLMPAAAPTSFFVRPMATTNGSQGIVTAAEGAGFDQLLRVSSSNPALASVPDFVTVSAGSGIGRFNIATAPVTAQSIVTISVAGGGVTRSAPLTLYPSLPALTTLTVNPTSVAGGATATGSVRLAGAAPAGGVSINLGSNLPLVARVPESVTVPTGATTATFAVTTFPSALTTVQLSAALDSVFQFAAITVGPSQSPPPSGPTLSALTLSPTSVTGGTAATGRVTLSSAAPSGGAVVSFSDNSGATTVPASVTVPAGASSASFNVTTSAVSANTTVTVTGTYNGTSRSGTLTVTPASAPPPAASLSTLALNPGTVTGGGTSQGSVTLTSAAPSGGALVTLSDNSTAVTVPASITVPAGATSANFTVATSAVTASTAATISAVLAGITRSATLTVNSPGAKVTLTVSASGRSGERVTSSPAGINVTVGSSGSALFAAGTAITLSVSNGRDAIWSGACSSGGNKTKTCTFTINGNASVSANVQ
jgi:hypothetical protein